MRGLAWPDADSDDAAEEIEVALPFHVPHVLHLAAFQRQRVLVVVGDGGVNVLLLLGDDLLAIHGGALPWRLSCGRVRTNYTLLRLA